MVEFRLFGAVDLKVDGRTAQSVLAQPKRVALLAYLALATPRGFHRRDILLALFWPDSDDRHARGALNQAIYHLRQSLGDALIATRGDDEVSLNWEEWWCDAVAMREAAVAGRHHEVLSLYRGELLAGFFADASVEFEHWLDGRRDELRAMALASHPDAPRDQVVSSPPPVQRKPRKPVTTIGTLSLLAIAFGVLVIPRTLTFGSWMRMPLRHHIDPNNAIVVADFTNRTSDPNLAIGITDALVADLTQSRLIRIASDVQVQNTLKRMGRAGSAQLTPDVAREVAVRDGLEAVLEGEVIGVGSGYMITAQLVTADSGEVVASARQRAMQPTDVIYAVDRLSKQLRRQMGESLKRLRANPPLEAVTTKSLDALKAYSAGRRAAFTRDTTSRLANQDVDVAIAQFEKAIALDSTFAAPYRALGVLLYRAGGHQQRATELLTRAYELRAHLSTRERLVTEGTYFSFAKKDDASAIGSFEQLLEIEPQNDAALQHLTVLYYRRRDYAHAVEVGEREWRARGGPPQKMYISALLGAGQLAKADSLLQIFAANDRGFDFFRQTLVHLRAATGDYRAVDTLLRPIPAPRTVSHLTSPYVNVTYEGLLAGWRMWHGQFNDGIQLMRRSPVKNPHVLAWNIARYDVFILHNSAQARRLLDSTLIRAPLELIPVPDRPYINIAEAYVYAGDFDKAEALLKDYRKVVAPDNRSIKDYTIDAIVSAHRGDIARARAMLVDADRKFGCWETTPWLNLGRALVEEYAHDTTSTIAAWETVVAPPACMLGIFADGYVARALSQAHGHERLAQLYDARGDRQRAAFHYGKFVELWSNADPALRPRVDAAKRRLKQLPSEEAARR